MIGVDLGMSRAWTLGDILYILPAFATLSLISVSFKLVLDLLSGRNGQHEQEDGFSTRNKLLNELGKFDGAAILTFRILRLLVTLALLGLEGYLLSAGGISSARAVQIPFLVRRASVYH